MIKKNILENNRFFLTLVLLGIFVHSLVFLLPIFDDAAGISEILTLMQKSPTGLLFFQHFPTGALFYVFVSSIFGISDFSMRLVPLLFNLASFFLIYKLSKSLYDESTARIAVLLCMFTFFPFFMSTPIEYEGGMICFFSLLCFYSLIESLKQNSSKKWIILFFISFGMSISIKLKSMILVAPILATILINSKFNIKKTIKYGIFVSLFAILIYGLNFAFVWFINKDYFPTFFNTLVYHNYNPNATLVYIISKLFSVSTSQTAQGTIDFVSSRTLNPFRFFFLIIYLTPLYLFTFLHQFKQGIRKNLAIISWIFFPVAFFFFGNPIGTLSIPRYSSVFFPFILILSADSISNIASNLNLILSKKKIILFFSSIAFLLLSYYYLSSRARNYFYLYQSIGPIIEISPVIFFSFYSLACIAFIIYFFSRNKSISIASLLIFFTFSITLNLFLISEPLINPSHRILVSEIKDYAREYPTPKIIYSWNEDVAYYANPNKYPIISITTKITAYLMKDLQNESVLRYWDLEHDFDLAKENIQKDGGTVILLNYPKGYINPEYGRLVSDYFDTSCKKVREKTLDSGSVVIYNC